MIILFLLSLIANVVLIAILHDQRHDLADLRIRAEEERTWSDEWERQATARAQDLAEMRQEYAKILWLHDGRVIQPLSAAWRAGLRLGKRQ